jgi:ArsR family transcriptional regulator
VSNTKLLPLLDAEADQAVVPCCPGLTERRFTAEEAETAARIQGPGRPGAAAAVLRGRLARGRRGVRLRIPDVGVSQPTVSHHLEKLKEAGLLTSERRGTWVYYRVEPSVLAAMGKLLTIAPAVA